MTDTFMLHVRIVTALAAATLLAALVPPVAAQVVMTPGQLTLPPARPAFTLSVAVSTDQASGETFEFSTFGGSAAVVTAKGVPVAFSSPLGAGAPYLIVQTGGPRNCSHWDNRRGFSTVNVVVTFSCGRSAGGTKVAGQLRALVGSRVDPTTGQVTAVAGPTVTNLTAGTSTMSRTGAFIVLGASRQLDKRYRPATCSRSSPGWRHRGGGCGEPRDRFVRRDAGPRA